MTVNDIRLRYLNFFAASPKNHAVIPAAPVVPLNDPTTLFSSSGMQQLVPFLKGEPHPMGKRLVDSQPSIRVEDIDEIGDNRHTTFFEMLGNWSLGDYFKQEQLSWIFEFLTQELGLDPSRLYVTVFAGNESVPKDEDSVKIWQNLFSTTAPAKPGLEGFDPHIKIYTYDATKNWWSRAGVPANMPPGEIGGPDSEMFFDFGAHLKLHETSPFADKPCHVNCDCGRFLEIGNSVFMEYIKLDDASFQPLPHQNVDFGGGLERLAAAVNNDPDVFTIDVFKPLIEAISRASGKEYQGHHQPNMRIIADHLRAAVFIMAQGITPSNKLQGYTLRRLLRRATLKARQLEVQDIASMFASLTLSIIKTYHSEYFSKLEPASITEPMAIEVLKFEKALSRGLKEFEKLDQVTGKHAFDLLQTYGFPWELSLELAQEKGFQVDRQEFEAEFKKHQDLSRSASQGLFKGGLAGNSETIIKYHTTTHLLHQALRQVLGSHVEQMGSNITTERLRFDFKHPEKLTDDQKIAIESLINQKIKEDLPVHKTIESKETALESGAMAFFREKYPDTVSVYTIGQDANAGWFSKELCGGPHVTSTGQIDPVTIKKEEAVGAGIRRIYMVLSPKN
jgi:alanyl-tRNA synthetase